MFIAHGEATAGTPVGHSPDPGSALQTLRPALGVGRDQERSVAEQELAWGHRSRGDQGPAPGGTDDHPPW